MQNNVKLIFNINIRVLPMKATEERILEAIKQAQAYSSEMTEALNTLVSQPLGTSSPAFLAEFATLCDKKFYLNDYTLWVALESYSQNMATDSAAKCLESVKSELNSIKQHCSQYFVRGILPMIIANGALIKAVYRLNDPTLTQLFQAYFPMPRARIFADRQIPPCVLEHEAQMQNDVNAFLSRHRANLPATMQTVIATQRRMRAKIRHTEYVDIVKRKYIEDNRYHDVKPLSDQAALGYIAEANTPYRPQQCSAELAARIVAAAKQVKLHSTVRTLTATGTIGEVFDTCLYGRKNLQYSYMSFRPAALYQSDIETGDGNVICFGPDKIDTQCHRPNTTEITLDLDLLRRRHTEQPNPCVFYKQRDFGFESDEVWSINIGKKTHYFSHTKALRAGARGSMSPFMIRNGYNGEYSYFSQIPRCKLISDNLADFDSILTLNFFRFIDNLLNCYCKPAPNMIAEIYSDIERLDERELIAFLTELGKKMTATAEFNFYGAYQFDFNLVKTITDIKNFSDPQSMFTIDLPEFILALNQGDLEQLEQAIERLPEVFSSQRFVDYLQSKVTDQSVQDRLTELMADKPGLKL